MQDLLNLFKQPGHVHDDFDSIRVSIASPEKIRSWSFGEVKKQKPSTIVLSNRNVMVCSVQNYSAQ